jgi:hypothetical protein
MAPADPRCHRGAPRAALSALKLADWLEGILVASDPPFGFHCGAAGAG